MMEDLNKYIDFNCNISELAQKQDTDAEFELIDYVSSVNISCGVHESSALEMKRVVEKCKFKNKVIGASIGLPSDVQTPLVLDEEEIEAIVLYQLGAISAFTKANGMNVEYVRPDGLMYKLAATDVDFSKKIASAVKKYSKWLLYYTAAGDIAKEVSESVNINVAQEILLNKFYKADKSPDFESEKALDNGLQLIRLRRLMNLDEIEVSEQVFEKFEYDTIHFDSKTENLNELLTEAQSIVIPRPVNYNNAAETGWVGINRNHYAQENNFEKYN